MDNDPGALTPPSAILSCFSVSRWRAWAPGVETDTDWKAWLAGKSAPAADSQPDVSQLPALLRRRLDRLGRMALHTAWPCLENVEAAEFVFASRDGSLPRTLELLTALIHNEPLSPTNFSTSIHNGTAGLYSMARGDRSATTAVAAGTDSLGMGLIEAVGMIAAGTAPVLLCYADERLPPPYETAPGHGSSRAPFSISLLLEAPSPDHEVCRLVPATGVATEAPEAALLRFLLEHAASTTLGVKQRWRLERSNDAGQA